MSVRTLLYSTLAITLALLAFGCGDSGAGNTRQLSAAGYLYSYDDNTSASARADIAKYSFVEDPDAHPENAVPAAGVTLDALDVQRQVLATVTTDNNGYFELHDLPAGYIALHPSGDGDGDGDGDGNILAMTIIPDRAIALGREYNVTREVAIAAVLAQVPETARVLGAMQPFDAGTTITPAYDDENDTNSTHAMDAAGYLFYIDYAPGFAFAHPTAYIIVNADNGTLTYLEGHTWPPSVNGAILWNDDTDFYAMDTIDDNRSGEVPAPLPDGFFVTPTPELLSAPSLEEQPDQNDFILEAAARDHNTEADSLFLINIRGDKRSDFTNDFVHFQRYFKAYGVPSANTWHLDFPQTKANRNNKSLYTNARDAVFQAVETRLADDKHSNLLVNISTHGPETYRGSGVGNQTFVTYYKDGASTRTQWSASDLKLETIRVCRLDVIVQTCFAEGIADALLKKFEPLDKRKRPQLTIYAAALKTEPARGNEVNRANQVRQRYGKKHIWSIPGSLFSNSLLLHSKITGGRFVGPQYDDEGKLNHAHFSKKVVFSTPKVLTLDGDPEWCDTRSSSATNSSSGTAVSSSSSSLSSVSEGGLSSSSSGASSSNDGEKVSIAPKYMLGRHHVAVTPCSQYIDEEEVTNNTGETVTVSVFAQQENADPSVGISFSPTMYDVQQISYDLEPGETKTTPVYFNCMTTTSFKDHLRHVVSIPSDEEEYTQTTDVEMRISFDGTF